MGGATWWESPLQEDSEQPGELLPVGSSPSHPCTQELGVPICRMPHPPSLQGTPGAREHILGLGRAPGPPTSLSGARKGPQTWCREAEKSPPKGREGGRLVGRVRPCPAVPGGEPSQTNGEQLTKE